MTIVTPEKTDVQSRTTERLEGLFDICHPLMADAIRMAAVLAWFDEDVLAALRSSPDGREAGLISRLGELSFVNSLHDRPREKLALNVREPERALILDRWIEEDRDGFLDAHRRAYMYYESSGHPDRLENAQALVYHGFFVDFEQAAARFVRLARHLVVERQVAALNGLVSATEDVRDRLARLEGVARPRLGNLLSYLRARIYTLRGDWDEALRQLDALSQRPDLEPMLASYVARSQGLSLAGREEFVRAIEAFDRAMTLQGSPEIVGLGTEDPAQERAVTLMERGRAHVGLALLAHGTSRAPIVRAGWWSRLRDVYSLVVNLPLMVYMARFRPWQPGAASALRGMDWLVARLIVNGSGMMREAAAELESHGYGVDVNAARLELARLDRLLGDPARARERLQEQLSVPDESLSEYRRAALRAELGGALLELGAVASAIAQIEEALPTLAAFEDEERLASAQEILASARLLQAEPEFAEAALRTTLGLQEGTTANARSQSETVSRIEDLLSEAIDLPTQAAQRIQGVLDTVTDRVHGVRMRHPLTKWLKRAGLLTLAGLMAVLPGLVLDVQSGAGLSPRVRFKPGELLGMSQSASEELSSAVVSNVVEVQPVEPVLWLGIAVFVGYVVLSVTLGWLAIVLTSKRSVQKRASTEAIHVSSEAMRTGGGPPGHWHDVKQLILADTRLRGRALEEASAFATVGADGRRVIVPGATNGYASLRSHVNRLVPDDAERIEADHRVLGSTMFWLYALGLALPLVIILVAEVAPGWAGARLPGLPYSVIDATPYLLVGLVAAPIWWAIIRPLRVQSMLNPRSRYPWLVLAGAVLFALLQWVIGFRPMLTAANLYPPLATIVVLVTAAWTIGRARQARSPAFGRLPRGIALLFALAFSLPLAFVLARDARAYHAFVSANALRDVAEEATDPNAHENLLREAVAEYERAAEIGKRPVLEGLPMLERKPEDLTPRRIGLVPPGRVPWIASLTSAAVLRSSLGEHDGAVEGLTDAMRYVAHGDELLGWRAVAKAARGVSEAGSTGSMGRLVALEPALRDFDEAIRRQPEVARHVLWRAIVLHGMGRVEDATQAYEASLAADMQVPLHARDRALANTGLGWLAYNAARFDDALARFDDATEVLGASSDDADAYNAWLGLGYTQYMLDDFAQAEQALARAVDLSPQDAVAWASHATALWKLGGRDDRGRVFEGDPCLAVRDDAAQQRRVAGDYQSAVDGFTAAIEKGGLEGVELAFAYRTRAQIHYLLRNCDHANYSAPEQYRLGYEDYQEALRLEPESAGYWQRSGGLALGYWDRAGKQPQDVDWLVNSWRDYQEAYARSPWLPEPPDRREKIQSEVTDLVTRSLTSDLVGVDFDELGRAFAADAARRSIDGSAWCIAGFLALSKGEDGKAVQRYRSCGLAAEHHPRGASVLADAIEQLSHLGAFVDEQPASAVRPMLERMQSSAVAARPASHFAQGRTALIAGDEARALAWTRRGLVLAQRHWDLASIRDAIRDAQEMTETGQTALVHMLEEAYPALSSAARQSGPALHAAIPLGMAQISLVLRRPDLAARWTNESIRRVTLDPTQYTHMQMPEAQELGRVLGENRTGGRALVDSMDAERPTQLRLHPQLEENGHYWRWGAWTAYHIARKAMVNGNQTGAREFHEQSARLADRALELDPVTHRSLVYVSEGAWAWILYERGKEQRTSGKARGALADFEAALEASRPVENKWALEERPLFAIDAAGAAAELGDLDRARVHLAEAATWMEDHPGPEFPWRDRSWHAINIIDANQALRDRTEDIRLRFAAFVED